MPLIRKRLTNIAANATVNPLSGDQYEYLPFNARVEFAVVANAITLDVTIYSGSDVLQQGGPPSLYADPITVHASDDFLVDDVAAAGERLNVVLRETGGVATTDAEIAVRITPI